jgi:hypothetical protein
MRGFQTWVVMLTLLLVAPLSASEGDDENGSSLRVFYDRGFRLGSSGDAFSLRINGLLQVRYTYVDYDPAIRYNQEDYSNFFVRRARLYFTGHTGSPRFTYFIHVQLEPSQGLKANDLWVEYSFSDLLRLGAGRAAAGTARLRLETYLRVSGRSVAGTEHRQPLKWRRQSPGGGAGRVSPMGFCGLAGGG